MERYDYTDRGTTGFFINTGGGLPGDPWEQWQNGQKAYAFLEMKRDAQSIYLYDDLRILDVKIPRGGGDLEDHVRETHLGQTNPWVTRYAVNRTATAITGGITDRRTAVTNGAMEIHPAIIQKWARSGGSAALGLPTSAGRCPDLIGYFAHFQRTNGTWHSIYWTPVTGAHIVKGAIRAKWESLGWERALGYPISDEFYIAGSAISIFQKVTQTTSGVLGLSDKNAVVFVFAAGIATEFLSVQSLAALGFPQFGGLAAVNSKLAFYQGAFPSDFKSLADVKAQRIKAFADPQLSDPLHQVVGSTAYSSGGDILGRIEAAYFCSGMTRPVDEVHVFCHGEGMGLYAKGGNQFSGLYVSEVYLNKEDREGGGCTMDSVASFPFANNLVFVLHSCGEAEQQFRYRAAYGPFALQLYQHLTRGGISNPSVYGQTRHHSWTRDRLAGKAVWIEYSNRYPSGGPKTIGLPGYE